MLEQKLDALLKEVADLKAKIGKNRVQWEEKMTETGIQLAGGSTTVSKTGTVLSVSVLPTGPGQVIAAFVIKADDGDKIAVIGADQIKFID